MIYRAFTALLIALGVSSVLAGQYGSCAPKSRFRVGNGVMTACDGSKFVARGINIQFGDNPGSSLPAFGELAKTNANILRIQLRTFTTGAQIQQALDATLKGGMIPLVMLWDPATTCGTDTNTLHSITDNWLKADWKAVLQNETYAPYIIINPVNEWSTTAVSRQTFRDEYKLLIQKMRTAGYTNPLSLNSYHCGQYPDGFTAVLPDTGNAIAKDLMASDSQKNVMFSYHGYADKWDTDAEIDANIVNLYNAGYPWLITEHGTKYGHGYDVSNHLEYWAKTRNMGIGVIAWSWHGNGDPSLDMSTTYAPTNPTPYGNDIIYGTDGTKNTAKKCPCLASVGGGGSAPAPAPTNKPQPQPQPQPQPNPGNCAGQFGQCGGQTWTGPTCCGVGFKCYPQDQWYSQCR